MIGTDGKTNSFLSKGIHFWAKRKLSNEVRNKRIIGITKENFFLKTFEMENTKHEKKNTI